MKYSKTKKSFTKAMLFGVFDGLHEGHKYLLRKAQLVSSELFVVVTRDDVVKKLKGRAPKYGEKERLRGVKEFAPSCIVLLGDPLLGSWGVIKEHKPDLVLLGYDQDGIAKELDKLSVPHLRLDSYKPEIYKSGIINRLAT